MIKAFNGVLLSNPLQYNNEWVTSKISQTESTSISGNKILYEIEKIKGINITLSSYEGGYLTKSEVDAIVALARTINQTVTITDDADNVINCRFNHTVNAVEATPLNPNSLYYNITINLFTI